MARRLCSWLPFFSSSWSMMSDTSKPDNEVSRDAGPLEDNEGAHEAQMDRRIVRAFDRRTLPIVCILYMLSYIDRGNMGNAKTAGAQEDLGLNSSQWTWVLNSFYVCYVLFEWSTMLWKLFPAHIFVSVICVLWGVSAMSSGAVDNMAQMIVTRCFLGVFEATFGVGAPYFLSLLYKRQELGLRMSFLVGMMPLANTFASSLAYGITQIKGSYLEPWRLLFVIEGAPSIAFAPVVYFFLIDGPDKAPFLTAEERSHAVKRLHVRDSTNRVNWRQVITGVLDFQCYMHGVIHFSTNYSFAALSNFLPTIVKDMGYDSVDAQGLTAPPYFAAFLLCLGAAFLSDRLKRRGYVIAAFSTMGAIGYGLLAGTKHTASRYAGVWLAACGIFPALSLNVTWILNNQGGDSKRAAGFAVVLIIGQCSSFVSSAVFPESDAPYYVSGCAIGCGLTGLVVLVALALHLHLDRENRRRDYEFGKNLGEETEVDVTEDGDKSPQFRYLT